MKVMGRGIVDRQVLGCGRVATNAQQVSFGQRSGGMDVMTIRTSDLLVVHLALDKRAVDIDLVVDLPVDVISGSGHSGSPGLRDLGQKMIEKRGSGMMIRIDCSTPGMAFGASRYLQLVGGIQVNQAVMRQAVPIRAAPGHVDVSGSRAVASFAGHVDLMVAGGKGSCFGIELFLQVG